MKNIVGESGSGDKAMGTQERGYRESVNPTAEEHSNFPRKKIAIPLTLSLRHSIPVSALVSRIQHIINPATLIKGHSLNQRFGATGNRFAI